VPEAARVASNLQMLNSRPAGEFHKISSVELCFCYRRTQWLERLGPQRGSNRVILRDGEECGDAP
jgi:hypothetical protein